MSSDGTSSEYAISEAGSDDVAAAGVPMATSSTSYRPIAPLPRNSPGPSTKREEAEETTKESSNDVKPPVASAAAGPVPTAQKRPIQLRHALPPKPGSSTSAPLPGSSLSSAARQAPNGDASAAAAAAALAKRVRLDSSLVPQAPKVPKTAAERGAQPHLIVVLEQACLETYKMSSSGSSSSAPSRGGARAKDAGDKFALLNCDDHQRVLAKMGRDIAEARPDITHQVR